MPRLNTGLEVLKQLDRLYKYHIPTGTIGDTTVGDSHPVQTEPITVAAITNFSASDPVFIVGTSGFELNQIDGSPATELPLLWPTALAYTTGDRLVEAQQIDLGHLDENVGVTFGGTSTLTAVLSAIARTPIAYIAGAGELTMSFGLKGLNNLNLLTGFGIDEQTGEAGAGTVAAPYTSVVGQTNVGTHGLQCYRAKGTRVDGKTVQIDFNNATIEVAVNTQLGTSTPPVIPVSLKCTTIITRIW